MDHIDAMDELKRGIGLRGYGSVKPIDAYKQEGFDMFEAMVRGIREETVRRLGASRSRSSPSRSSPSPAATIPAPAAR